MGMQAVVMLKPRWQLRQDRLCISEIAKGHIVSFKGFYKALSHAVGLRTFNGRGHRLNVQTLGKISDLFGGVARAVIGQKLNCPRYGTDLSKTLLDCGDQHVLDTDGINTPGGGYPANRLPVTAILGKGHTDTLFVPAGDLKTIGAPADIACIDRHPTIMGPGVVSAKASLGQQELVISHDPIDPLAVNRKAPLGAARIADHPPDTDIAVAGPTCNDRLDLAHDLGIGCRALSGSPAIAPIRGPGAHRHNVAARNAKSLTDRLDYPSSGNAGERASHFFALAKSTASS